MFSSHFCFYILCVVPSKTGPTISYFKNLDLPSGPADYFGLPWTVFFVITLLFVILAEQH
jgi:hypothetical protein